MSGPIVTGYQPRPQQAEIHLALKRFSVLVCHRRFGKTVLCVNALIDAALRCQRERPRFAYLAPLQRQAKDIAWDYLKAYTRDLPGLRVNEAELRVDFGRDARVRLYGADNPDSLRGSYFDGVVLDEYAQMSPKVWTEVLRPALSDRGGWAVFIGTPKGRNAFWELYDQASRDPDWHAAMYRASQTGIVPKPELDSARLQMTPEEYEQEFECSFQAAIVGAYYGRAMAQMEAEGRIGRVPPDPRVAVDTAWDLGFGDSTAIWFCQRIGREVRLIDYLEGSGVGLDWYAKELDRKPYTYGTHILPHDAGQGELGTGQSRIETLRQLGLKRTIVLPRAPIEDGINAGRLLLAQTWADAERCKRGLEALRQYRREWDDVGKVLRPKPKHDWTSHAADAFRYLAVGLPSIHNDVGPRRAPETMQSYDPLSYIQPASVETMSTWNPHAA